MANAILAPVRIASLPTADTPARRLRYGTLLLVLCVVLQCLSAAALRGHGAAHVHLQAVPARIAIADAGTTSDPWLALAWLARSHDHGQRAGQAHHHDGVQRHLHAHAHADASALPVASADPAWQLPLALATLHATDGLLSLRTAAAVASASPCWRPHNDERFASAWVATPQPPPRG